MADNNPDTAAQQHSRSNSSASSTSTTDSSEAATESRPNSALPDAAEEKNEGGQADQVEEAPPPVAIANDTTSQSPIADPLEPSASVEDNTTTIAPIVDPEAVDSAPKDVGAAATVQTQLEKTTAALEDLFGSDSDDDESIGKAPPRLAEKAPKLNALSGSESDEKAPSSKTAESPEQAKQPETPPPPPEPEKEIIIQVPCLCPELDDSLHLFRVPKFMRIDTKPFSVDASKDPYESIDNKSAPLSAERQAEITRYVQNTIRWRRGSMRTDPETNEPLEATEDESNARLVRWSDGTYSVYVGTKLVADCFDKSMEHEHSHLFFETSGGQLQGCQVLQRKMLFRTSEVLHDGARRFGSRVVNSALVAEKLARETKTVTFLAEAGDNPEIRRAQLARTEEERLKASIRRDSQRRRTRERSHMRGLNHRYLEGGGVQDDDDDENTISVAKIRRAALQTRERQQIYSDSGSDASTDDEAAATRPESDDDDEAIGGRSKRAKHRSSAPTSTVSESASTSAAAAGTTSSQAPVRKRAPRILSSDED